ncbi:MAG: hypothetical protein GY847_14145 [Proteobacteria bacterium]|nr:hypothetical protein [Pseudomonadota bacterium]
MDQNLHIEKGTATMLFGIPLAAIVGAISIFEKHDGRFYRILAGAIAGITAGLCLIIFPSPIASLTCIGIGVVYIATGFLRGELWLLVTGLVGVAGAFIYHIHTSSKPTNGAAGAA